MQQIIFAIAVIAALILAIGGVRQMAKPEEQTRGVLMIAAAIVLIGNVLIWVVPI